MNVAIGVYITDSTVTASNPAKTGLTPTILSGIKLSDATAVASGVFPAVASNAGAGGLYTFTYDPDANGEAIFQVDAGSALSTASDRYFAIQFTKDSGRILTALPPTGTLAVKPAVTLAAADVSGKLPATVGSGDGADSASLLAAVNASQSGGTVVSSATANNVSVLTVSGLTVPAANCGGMAVDVFDQATGKLKARATVAANGGAVSGSNAALTLTSLLSSVNANDTVQVF